MLLADRDEFLVVDLPLGIGEVQEEHHRRPLVDGGLELLSRFDLDHPHAGIADRMVVVNTVGLLYEDFALEAGGVGELPDPLGIFARHAGCCRQRERRGAARGHQCGLAAEQLGDPGAHRHMQVVEPNVLARGDLHGGHHLGPHERAGESREGARGVDERADAQFPDHITRRGGGGLSRDRGIAASQEAQAGNTGQGTKEGPTLGLGLTHVQPPRVRGWK